MRYGAYEVEDTPRRPAPIDASVLGTPPSEVTARGEILRTARCAVRHNHRMKFANEFNAERHDPPIQAQRRVLVADFHRALPDDIACLAPRDHVIHRDASFTLAVDNHPVDRRAPAVLRQPR